MPDFHAIMTGRRNKRLNHGLTLRPILHQPDVRNRTSLIGRRENRQLIIVRSKKGQIIQTTRAHRIPPAAHVCLAQGSITGNHGLDQIVPHNEITDNPIRFLPSGQAVSTIATHFKRLGSTQRFR